MMIKQQSCFYCNILLYQPLCSTSLTETNDLWISGGIEMMTPLNLFCFGDGGPIWTPIEKLVQL